MMRRYTIAELREIAMRGKNNPASLTPDEIRALCLYLKGLSAQ